ncbi:Venom serine protease Bi-VSP [Amphibalanus amphitrite]|uniref:Venom serine protease Bi-VSP n=1 Tax=Amphibalanus amphitrite TaxID=1232801 RepID=A0A6A4VYF2_AMPAM|nr:Venom serine protease Bi-VSP [Amphibalanus amphitrite]
MHTSRAQLTVHSDRRPPGGLLPSGYRVEHTAAVPSAGRGGKLGAVGAHVGRWPWLVLSVTGRTPVLGGWFCGGALITDQHVLTAAHCIHPEEAGTVGAVIGDTRPADGGRGATPAAEISRVVRHPRFIGAQNDVAVVRLSTPVELTGAVWPVCLPPRQSPVTGGPLWAAGWGATQRDGHPASEMTDTPLQLTDLNRCEETYRRTPLFDARFPGGFQGTKLCASRVGGAPRDSAACPADSGGPLMEPTEGDRYQVVGVWSIEGQQIRPLPCRTTTGGVGVCMFVWDCSKRGGTAVGICTDRFMFGGCCELPESPPPPPPTASPAAGDGWTSLLQPVEPMPTPMSFVGVRPVLIGDDELNEVPTGPVTTDRPRPTTLWERPTRPTRPPPPPAQH